MSTSRSCNRIWTDFCPCQCQLSLENRCLTGYGIHIHENNITIPPSVNRTWEKPLKILFFAQVKSLEGNFSLWVEDRNGAGSFLSDIPRQYYSQTLVWLHRWRLQASQSSQVALALTLMVQTHIKSLGVIASSQATLMKSGVAQLLP